MGNMARIWNGDDHMHPDQNPFVMLTSPDTFYHQLCGATGWHDVQAIILDDAHSMNAMVLLLFSYIG